MQAAKRVAVNTGFLYGRMAITVVISLYATRLILNALGAEDFGLFNLVGGVILMLGFINASMAEATQRFMSFAQGSGNYTKVNQIFNVSIVLHLLIAFILFLVLELTGYYLIERVLNIPDDRIYAAKLVYHFMVISAVFTVISVPYDAVINARENMLLFAILGIIESVLKLMIALIIVNATTDKLIIYGLLTAFLPIILLMLRIWYCQKYYQECKLSIRSSYSKSLMREMTGFAGWSSMGYTTSMIAFYGQGLVLNVFFGTILNAAQGIAIQISGQLSAFAHTMMRALNPTIAKSEGAGDRELMRKAAMMGSKISFFLLMLLYIPVLVEMEYVLTMWLKDVPPFTIIFCQLLLIRNLLEQLFLTLVTSIAAVGKIKKFQIFGSILSVFPLLVSYFLFKIGYPPYTLYIVFIGYSILASINILYFSNKTFGLSISVFFKDVVARCVIPFLCSIIITSIPMYTMPEGLLRLGCIIALSILSFLIFVWIIGFSKIEKQYIKNIIESLYMSFRLRINKVRKPLVVGLK